MKRISSFSHILILCQLILAQNKCHALQDEAKPICFAFPFAQRLHWESWATVLYNPTHFAATAVWYCASTVGCGGYFMSSSICIGSPRRCLLSTGTPVILEWAIILSSSSLTKALRVAAVNGRHR